MMSREAGSKEELKDDNNVITEALNNDEPAGQGWESGEPMYEGDPGTWGNNINTNEEEMESKGVDDQVLKEMQDLISKSKV